MGDNQDQLADFDRQIIGHPQLASSYATNGFLSALVQLNKESVSGNITLLKGVIRAFTIILPPVFLTICRNETETSMWANTEELLQALQTLWVNHTNTGVRIYAFKCLQLLISLESKKEKKTEESKKDIFSLNLVRPGHRLLNVPRMEKEGIALLDVLLDRLCDNNENYTVITAIINCLTLLVKRRPQFTRAVIGALVDWCKNKPEHMAPTDVKNIDKSIKLAFVAMIRTSRLSAYRSELLGAYSAIGGNPSALQSRSSRTGADRHDETRRKRSQAAESNSDRAEKKAKTQSTHQPPMPSVDMTSLPLNVAADLCVAILQNVAMETLNDRIKMVPESFFTQSSTRHRKPSSSAKKNVPPMIKKEPSTSITKTELKLSNAMASTSHARPPPLASTEERASQSFKMQPYNLADLQPVPEDQQFKLLQMSMQRLLSADYFAQELKGSSTISSNTAKLTTSSRLLTWDSTTKIFWAALISKVFTLGTRDLKDKSPPPRQDNDDQQMAVDSEQEEMKEHLLSFILEDFPNRYDLALAWLHEERYFDMQSSRRQTLSPVKSYYTWLERLMDGSIATCTNPKDKTLTKVLLAAPALNNDVIEKIHILMRQQQTNRFVMCVATLRDLATQRPPVRARCLSILLALCTDPDVKTRSTAIAAVKRWVPSHTISKQVERHAVDIIQVLLSDPPLKNESMTATTDADMEVDDATSTVKNDDDPEEPAMWEEQDIVRHLDLFFAVCTKKHDLLEELFPVYTQTSQQVQRFIRQHIYSLITNIGISSEALVNLVKEYQPGCETLILRILKILCDTAPTTPALRALVKDIYVRKGLRAKFMLPIFTQVKA